MGRERRRRGAALGPVKTVNGYDIMAGDMSRLLSKLFLIGLVLLLPPAASGDSPRPGADGPSVQEAMIAAARELLGVSYRFGGRLGAPPVDREGIDCQGVLFYAAERVGRRCSWRSYSVFPTRSVERGELGRRVAGLDPVSTEELDPSLLEPGDVLLLVGFARNPAERAIGKLGERDTWVWHTGLYSGEGRWIVGDHFAGEVIETDLVSYLATHSSTYTGVFVTRMGPGGPDPARCRSHPPLEAPLTGRAGGDSLDERTSSGEAIALERSEGDPCDERAPEEPQRFEAYRWGPTRDAVPLSDRVAPPPGFSRVDLSSDGFGAWLRGLPTKPGRPTVYLHDGTPKANQRAHHLVIDIDTGTRDLQQCADAVIRLRAEWLFASGEEDRICFRFTSGEPAWWTAWRDGARARVEPGEGRGAYTVEWRQRARPDDSHAGFRRYLDLVFVYAGSWSLARELRFVEDPEAVRPGDVLIQGGFPGHAVIVLDLAEHSDGRRVVILGQSFMPAQDFHVLAAPGSAFSPWYLVEGEGPVVTPEWRFDWKDLMRFQDEGCPPFREP